ncbi:hypothetical protein JHK87_004684 [Glycine soja]|nr:hypothetical protein JHK87_004684 [Glycine soja]
MFIQLHKIFDYTSRISIRIEQNEKRDTNNKNKRAFQQFFLPNKNPPKRQQSAETWITNLRIAS